MDTEKLEELPKQDGEIQKGKKHIIVELIEYEHDEVVSKSIMKKITGSINAMAFDTGEGLNEKTSPFDTYLQIIDGSAIIVVDAAGGYSYSRGWRQFSRMVLHPGLRLLIKLRWQGKENIPRTGGIILAPNHLSYADWATIAIFSDGYAHRYPVFMIKSGIFEVKVIGPLMYKFGQLPVYRDDARLDHE